MFGRYYMVFCLRPYWQQQCVLFITALLFLLLGYVIVLLPYSYHLDALAKKNVSLQKNIAVLDNKITHYSNKDVLMHAINAHCVASMSVMPIDMYSHVITIAKKVSMTFIKATQYTKNNHIEWQIQLRGQYQQFVLLLNEFYTSSDTVKIHDVGIRSQSDELFFSLTLL